MLWKLSRNVFTGVRADHPLQCSFQLVLWILAIYPPPLVLHRMRRRGFVNPKGASQLTQLPCGTGCAKDVIRKR